VVTQNGAKGYIHMRGMPNGNLMNVLNNPSQRVFLEYQKTVPFREHQKIGVEFLVRRLPTTKSFMG
jgi:hypothetical protein